MLRACFENLYRARAPGQQRRAPTARRPSVSGGETRGVAVGGRCTFDEMAMSYDASFTSDGVRRRVCVRWCSSSGWMLPSRERSAHSRDSVAARVRTPCISLTAVSRS